jgi:tetratricopeptide (TPR) repeat protein
MGAPRAIALCYNFGGALDFQAGLWASAEQSLRDAARLYAEVGSASGESLSLQRLGVLLTARGRLDEARALLVEGMVVAARAAMRSHCLTRLHASMIRNRLAAGDRDGIELSLSEGLEAQRRHGDCVTCNALLLPEVVRAEIALGRVDAAEASCARLQRIAADFDSQVWTAMAAQAQGRVLLARGHRQPAFDALERARSAYAEVAQPYEVARCLAAQAVCVAGSDPAAARGLDDQARTLFASLGSPGSE